MVARAGQDSATEHHAALSELCRRYWPPLHHFLRRQGTNEHDAKDLVQGFFASLIERGAIARADASRGRFRTFLIASLKNYTANQNAHANRQKRGGGFEFVPLTAATDAEPETPSNPTGLHSVEAEFDRRWAHTLIELVLQRLHAEFECTGKREWFEVMREALWSDRDSPNYAALAQRLGSTEGAIKVAMHRLRRRFGDYLREEVGRTVERPDEVETELRHLLQVLRT